MRRLILSTILTLSLAAPAAAKEPAQKAFDLLSRYTAERTDQNYIKLQSSIPAKDAQQLDAKLSALYGEPSVTRAGLKVWEVENPSPSFDQAQFTTIMCGPDGQGGFYISADSRGPKAQNTRSDQLQNSQGTLRVKQASKRRSSNKSTFIQQGGVPATGVD